jgi:hypothetical protein
MIFFKEIPMNKKLLGLLSLMLLVSILPACGKKSTKKSDKKAYHHKKHEKKHKKSKGQKKSEPMMQDEEMK